MPSDDTPSDSHSPLVPNPSLVQRIHAEIEGLQPTKHSERERIKNILIDHGSKLPPPHIADHLWIADCLNTLRYPQEAIEYLDNLPAYDQYTQMREYLEVTNDPFRSIFERVRSYQS